MPHIKNVYRYKDMVEVERVHSGRYGRRADRGSRTLPTQEEMRKINERNAIKKLRRKIYANFEPGDLFLTLTYKRELRPAHEDAPKLARKFLRRLRAEYKRRGQDLKYISVTEYGKTAVHHHLVTEDLPDGSGGKLASSLWDYGGVHLKYLYEDGQYEMLASYLVKETGKHFGEPGNHMKCRYTCSRNMVDPQKKTQILKRDDWPEVPRVPPGHDLIKDSLFNGINKLGYRYQYYSYRKTQSHSVVSRKNRKKGEKSRTKAGGCPREPDEKACSRQKDKKGERPPDKRGRG